MVSVAQIAKKLENLPEEKLAVVLDFVSFLESEMSAEFMRMQTLSSGYREWLSAENDVYDELFADEVRTG